MTTETSIVSEGTEVELESGFKLNIERLKTRQLFRLLKIVTKGLGDAVSLLDFGNKNQEEITATLLTAVVFAIPEAEDETLEFLVSMATPVGAVKTPSNKIEESRNEELFEKFYQELLNPEIEDTIKIISKIITNEAPHIVSLGKQLTTLLKVQGLNLQAKGETS